MATFQTKTKRWGNSMGLVIPRHVTDELGIMTGDMIDVEMKKRLKVKDIYGLFPRKGRKTEETQKFKDQLRKGWSKW
jgi:antitoxin component of MazEF toxin-antitoxin module